MCGLVSVISKNKNGFVQKEIDIFTELLYADQLRGSDGTGIFFNNNLGSHSVNTLKAPIMSCDFVRHAKYFEAEKNIMKSSNFVVGHNRAATRGKLTQECTHPFREKHITLVHNGTLTTQKELHPTIEVDSHAICHSIATSGYKETLKNINGAFALIWFDSNKGTLNICRNSQRPLSIIECRDVYIVCSELELGLWIAKRNSMFVTKSQDITINTLYQFKVSDMSKYETEDVEYKKFYATTNLNYSKSAYWNDYFDYGDENKGKETVIIKNNKDKDTFYNIGANVVCKADHIVTDKVPYLVADIVKDKTVPIVSRTKDSYEKQYRVRIFGTKTFLEELLKKEHIEGTVAATTWRVNTAHYTLRDVRLELNILNLKKADINNVDLCNGCTKDFNDKETRHHIDGLVLCGACSKIHRAKTVSVH